MVTVVCLPVLEAADLQEAYGVESLGKNCTCDGEEGDVVLEAE
jgi:hypothetical protein